MNIDLNDPTKFRIHIVGIGGAGMSAIATVLAKMGKSVSGSDLKQSLVTERLEVAKIDVHIPHSKAVITEDIDLLVRSSAIDDENEEVLAARNLGIPVVSRAEMLQAICSKENSIGIAGSHGKTTTTSMATAIARSGDLNPSFMIGGDVNEIGTNAGYTKGSVLIVEADESDRTFLDLPLNGAIITNIESDHLENYNNSFDELIESFCDFAIGVDGPVAICVDEKNARSVAIKVAKSRDIITVGAIDADWEYKITSATRGGISADVKFKEKARTKIELAVPGAHNIRNAMCAFALMSALGVEDDHCVKGLASFGGVARRFQFRGQTKGITFVDDYAHLPSEISATLDAAKDGKFGQIISIFQPHRYSRTQALYKDFAESLMESDVVAICDIYSAGEEPRPGVSGSLISNTLESLGHLDSTFIQHVDDLAQFVESKANPGDIVLTLGAGDVTMYSDIIQSSLNDPTCASHPNLSR